MRKRTSSMVGTTTVKKEIIEIDSDSDTGEVGGGVLALCGEADASCKPLNTPAEKVEANKTSMQIVCADDSDSDLDYDLEYKKYLSSYRMNHQYMLEMDTSPMRLTYNVGDEATDGSQGRAVKLEKIRAGSPLVSSFSKKLKTENGEADHRSISRTVEETQPKKGDARQGRKAALTKNTIKLEPTSDAKDTQQKKVDGRRGRKAALTKRTFKLEPASDVNETQQKKEDGRRGRKSSVTKNKIEVKPTVNLRDTKQMKEDGRRGRKSSVTKNMFKACKEENEESSAYPQTILRASKRLKAEKTIPMVNTKETLRKKEVARRGRKSSVTKNIFKACKEENEESSANSQTFLRASKRPKAEKTIPMVNTKETQRKKEVARRGRKSSVTKNNFKACKKENEESSARRNEKSQAIFRASKRLKAKNGRADHNSISRTIPVVNTKRKKGEASRVRKIPVTKTNVESKSTSHVKDNLLSSFKARKTEDEESRASLDKSYEHFLSYLKNSIIVFEPNRKVKPEKDLVSLSDPDIIAISDYPFSDGGNSTFQANKDGKVIDLEDGIEPDTISNSSFSKKLLEILRKPYDKTEFLQRCDEASRKRQLTRSRQLRDGKEIEYLVEDQLGPSYLEQYPDFNKMFRSCRYGKDPPRALNLLRGFFFYFENIVLEGAFKPWLHEKLVWRECQDIVCIE